MAAKTPPAPTPDTETRRSGDAETGTTPANGVPYDNLSYRGYSSQQPGYVYRNPYAASPSVSVQGYTRTDGTFVAPYYRTYPNSTVTDNLSYRGYGTIRVPRSSLGW